VLHVGGNWNNGGNVSLVYSNGNNTPSTTNINIGARLILKEFYIFFNPPFGKSISKKMIGS